MRDCYVRCGAALVMTAALALCGCSGPSGGEELSPAAPAASVSMEPTVGTDNTASAYPSTTEEPRVGKEHSASGDPSSTEEPTVRNENTASADPSSTKGSPPASTPVPPPTPGSINETVEARPVETKDPVGIEETAMFNQQVMAEITSVKEIDEPLAGMPNEVPEPAVVITVTLTNETSRTIPMDSVVVELLDSTEAPGGRMTGDPYDPLAGTLAAGESASGTYVYTVAKSNRHVISIIVTLTADQPIVLFRGPVE